MHNRLKQERSAKSKYPYFILFYSFIFVLFPQVARAQQNQITLNVLAPMGLLDAKVVQKFESENRVNVYVEFVGNRAEYESKLRAGLRTYDVVIADERTLEKLYLNRLIRILNDALVPPLDKAHPLTKRTKLNPEGNAFIPFLADPMGIAYREKNSKVTEPVSWNILITPNENPFWRQRIFVSNHPKQQLLLALLVSKKEISPSSAFIPEPTLQWLKQLRLQNVNIKNTPLELAFLGNQISAAVVFYSDYLRYRKVVPNLRFVVPEEATYYTRYGLGWPETSLQEALAKKLIEHLYKNKEQIAKKSQLLDINSDTYGNTPIKNWSLYDDDAPLPKRIDNTLKEMASTN